MGEYGMAFQNEPVDVSGEFVRQENHYFVGSKVTKFDPLSASGTMAVDGADSSVAEGLVCLPEGGELHHLPLQRGGDRFALTEDPLAGRVAWNLRTVVVRNGHDA
jgi:hypothetical protein